MDAIGGGKGVAPSITKQLNLACERGDLSKVTQHLDTGISVDTPLDDDGNSALSVAAAHAQEDVVRFLLKRGASLEHTNAYGWTPIMHAARHGNANVVHTLINNKADLRVSSHVGASALHCGVCSADVSTVRTLIEAGLEVTTRSRSAAGHSAPTPLSLAASLGNAGVVRLLLDRGADADRCHDSTNLTPLMLAAINGHFDAVKTLVDFGANPNLNDILGHTALEYAAKLNRTDVEMFLRDRTSFVRPSGSGNGRSFDSWRVKADMIEAARQGDLVRIKELILEDPRHANNCSPQDGATPLIYASVIGRLDIVEVLVSANAHLDVQDKVTGWTALMQATFKGHKDVVKYLINAGANVDVRAKNGATAFTLATTIDDADTEMVRLVASKQTSVVGGKNVVVDGKKMGVVKNSSSIAWMTPARIVAKAKDVTSGTSGTTDTATLPSVTRHSSSEDVRRASHALSSLQIDALRESRDALVSASDDAYLNHAAAAASAKNGSLKHWWNRMSNRFRNLKLGRTFRLAPMPYPNDAATPVYDVDVASTPLDDGVSNQRQSTSASFSNLAIYTGSASDEIHSLPSGFSETTENAALGQSITDNGSSLNAPGNASLRSLSSGYASLIFESSGKPQLTLDLSSSNALSGPHRQHHPKLQDDLLKPVVPPFHLPPGFESPADDIFSQPFGSPNDKKDVDDDRNSLDRRGVVVGTRALSGTATSPMPPGRTSRPVAKLFVSHQTGKKNPSPSSSTILSHGGAVGGGGTPSPHSSGGASSVSGVMRLPHSLSGGSSGVRNAQNSSLLMSSGDSSTLTAGSDPNGSKPGCNTVGSSPGFTTGSSTISGTGSGSISSSSSSIVRGGSGGGGGGGGVVVNGLSFLHGSRVGAYAGNANASSSSTTTSALRHPSPSSRVPPLRQSARSLDSRDSGTLTPTPSHHARDPFAARDESFRTLSEKNDVDAEEDVTDALTDSRAPASATVSAQDDLAKLLAQLSLERYQPIFEEQEVDIEAFLTLNNEDLKELGIDASPARDQILGAIERLNEQKS